MRVYLAARYEMHPTMREWRRRLAVDGVAVTARWITGEHAGSTEAEKARYALEDLEDIRTADALIAFNPPDHHRSGRGGRHVELGYALALAKPVVIVGARENVFHWHPEVLVVSTLDAAIAGLSRLFNGASA